MKIEKKTRIGYRVLTANDEWKYDFVEASSNEEALVKLKKQNLESAELVNDAMFLTIRDDLKDLSDAEFINTLKFEDERQQNPSMLKSFVQMVENNKIVFLFSLSLFVYYYFNPSLWSLIAGMLLLILPIAWWFKGYRDVMLFDEIARLMVLDHNEETLYKIKKMKKRFTSNLAIQAQLDTNKAQILACQGNTYEAFEIIEQYKEYYETTLPGMYHESMSNIYYIIGEYEASIEEMEKMYEVNPSSNMAFDLAFSQLRNGNDISNAKHLLEEVVDVKTIPAHSVGLYYWALALLAHKEGKLKRAKAYYETMLRKFNEYQNSVHTWSMLALGTGSYADLLADMGLEEQGKILLNEKTIKILNIHLDDRLRKNLTRKYPALIKKKTFCNRD